MKATKLITSKPATLNSAYRHGNVIYEIVPSGESCYLPVIIEQKPGVGSILPPNREAAICNAGLLVKAFLPESGVLDSMAFASVGPGTLMLQGSGVLGDPAALMTLWTGKTPFGGKFSAIDATGDFFVNGHNSLTVSSDGPVLVQARQEIKLHSHGSSGLTEYRLGQQEGWYVRHSNSNQYKLMPDEDQVRELVLEILKASGVL